MTAETIIDGWEGRNVFVRASTPTRTRNAQLRRAKPPVERPPSLYILVFQFRPKGTHWTASEYLVFPYLAHSVKELQGVTSIAGCFEYLFKCRPELRDRQRWKVTAAYENARVWAQKQKKDRA